MDQSQKILLGHSVFFYYSEYSMTQLSYRRIARSIRNKTRRFKDESTKLQFTT